MNKKLNLTHGSTHMDPPLIDSILAPTDMKALPLLAWLPSNGIVIVNGICGRTLIVQEPPGDSQEFEIPIDQNYKINKVIDISTLIHF